MKELGLKKIMEGIIVTVVGIICFYLAIIIPDNPVKVSDTWLNFFTEARLFPLIAGGVIILLGISMVVGQLRGKIEVTIMSLEELRKVAVVFLMTLIYVILVLNIGYKISTILYLTAVLFFLNKGVYKPLLITILAVVFTIVGTFLVPMMINLQLP